MGAGQRGLCLLQRGLGRGNIACGLRRLQRRAGGVEGRLRIGHGLIGGVSGGGFCSHVQARCIQRALRGANGIAKRGALQGNGGIHICCGLLGCNHCGVGGRNLVGGGQHGLTRHAQMAKGRGNGGRVCQCLIGNQVRNDARIGIIDRARGLQIRCGACLRCAGVHIGQVCSSWVGQEGRIQKARHHLIRGAIGLATGHQVVQRAIHQAQAVGQKRVQNEIGQRGAGRVLLGDENLIKNMFQVIRVYKNHVFSPKEERPTALGVMKAQLAIGSGQIMARHYVRGRQRGCPRGRAAFHTLVRPTPDQGLGFGGHWGADTG